MFDANAIRRQVAAFAIIVLGAAALSSCAAYSVVSTAASVTGTAVSTTASVAGTAVSTTAKGVGAAADAVIGDDKEKPKED